MKALSLHHEYINRHQLKTQLFLYNPKTCLFLRRENTSGPVEWRILAIHWRVQERKPSFFEFNYSQVLFDRHLLRNVTKDIITEVWYWDEYEKKLLDLFNSVKTESFRAICWQEESLAAWEIFLLLADSLLVKCQNAQFYKNIETSLRVDVKIEERQKACFEAQNYLKFHHKEIYEIWYHQIFSLVQFNDSQWLANLIND